jgi:hypothetical protein
MTPPPGEFGLGGVRIPGMHHAQAEDTPPSDNVRHLVLAERNARIELGDQVESMRLEMFELRRVIADFSKHLAGSQWKNWLRSLGSSAVFATIFAAIIGTTGQLWSTKMMSEAQQKADVAAEQKRAREREAEQSKLLTKLEELDAKIEQNRRGYPQPLHQAETKAK